MLQIVVSLMILIDDTKSNYAPKDVNYALITIFIALALLIIITSDCHLL